MKRIALAKLQKEKRTPEPSSSPPLKRGNPTPDYSDEPTTYNHRHKEERANYREEPANYREDPIEYAEDTSYSQDHYSKDKLTNIEDSDSDDLESLESFISLNLKPELSEEEWLFVSMLSRRTESRKTMVSEWLRKGSEDEFDDMPEYRHSRRTDYRRSPSPMPRYKSPPVPRPQSPLSKGADMDTMDIFKIATGPSRYLERVERRSLSSPPCVTPPPQETPDLNREYTGSTASPIDPAMRQSPDWERERVSPPRSIDQMTGHRYSPQAPATTSSIRHNVIPARQTPSPKFSSGQRASPLERVSSPGYQLPPHRHYTPTHEDSTQELMHVGSAGRDRSVDRREALPEPRTSMLQPRSLASPQTRMPARQLARPQIRAPQALGARPPRSLQAPSSIRARSSRDS